jgi:hypothetical protein
VSFLSVLALFIAVVTAGYVLYRDPPMGRLGKYNFSTPEEALRSNLRMEANGDVFARIELEEKLGRKEAKERISTLEVNRTAEFKGKTILFIQYKATDKHTKEQKDRKQVVWFVKDEDTGIWQPTTPGADFQMMDKKLSQDIAEWEGWGKLGMPQLP